jgi:hypothetical protein
MRLRSRTATSTRPATSSVEAGRWTLRYHSPIGQPGNLTKSQAAAMRKAAIQKGKSIERLRAQLTVILRALKDAKGTSGTNTPKLTLSSIAERAGIDRKTLDQPHHAPIKRGLLRFIARYQQRRPVSEPARTPSRFEQLNSMLDELAIENRHLRRLNAECARTIAALEATRNSA